MIEILAVLGLILLASYTTTNGLALSLTYKEKRNIKKIINAITAILTYIAFIIFIILASTAFQILDKVSTTFLSLTSLILLFSFIPILTDAKMCEKKRESDPDTTMTSYYGINKKLFAEMIFTMVVLFVLMSVVFLIIVETLTPVLTAILTDSEILIINGFVIEPFDILLVIYAVAVSLPLLLFSHRLKKQLN
jgi:hypothetical protein